MKSSMVENPQHTRSATASQFLKSVQIRLAPARTQVLERLIDGWIVQFGMDPQSRPWFAMLSPRYNTEYVREAVRRDVMEDVLLAMRWLDPHRALMSLAHDAHMMPEGPFWKLMTPPGSSSRALVHYQFPLAALTYKGVHHAKRVRDGRFVSIYKTDRNVDRLCTGHRIPKATRS